MRLFSCLLLLLTAAANVTASEYDMIYDSQGKIIYLELDGDAQLRVFLQIQEHCHADLALRTLVLANLDKLPDESLSQLTDFLSKFGQSLEHLMVVGRSKKASDLDAHHLLEILKSIENSPLRLLRWENQGKISDVAQAHTAAKALKIWQQLEEISFKETPFLPAAFFIQGCQLSVLKSLDLSYTEMRKGQLKLMARHPERLPVLERLYLNGNANLEDFESLAKGGKAADLFQSLRVLSVYDESYKQSDYIDFAEKTATLMPNLEALYCFVRPEDDQKKRFGHDGTFVSLNWRRITGDNLGKLSSLYDSFPALQSTGQFFAQAPGPAGNNATNASRNNWFLADPKQLATLLESEIAGQLTHLTLLGPVFSLDEVLAIAGHQLNLPQLRNVFLVGNSLEPDQLETAAAIFSELPFNLHAVTFESADRSPGYHKWYHRVNDPHGIYFAPVKPPTFTRP